MNISAKDWDAYVKTLRLLSDTAANKLQAYINKYGIDNAEAIAEYAHALITKYGEGSAELACQMYDAIGQAEGVILPSAVPAPIPAKDEVERAVLGSFAQSPTGKVTASIADRYVKLAAEDTMARNAIRDRAEWAWVPHGDTCAFCITLASRGWQMASKRILRGGHAEHVHAHCDCQFAIRHDGKSNVSGYNPDKYYQMYKNAEGNSPKEKINSLRRDLEQNKKEIIAIDEAKNELASLSTRVHINKKDALYTNVQNVKPISNYNDFAIHGEPAIQKVMYETTNGKTTYFTARDYADIILNDPEYDGGKVRLLSCGMGNKENGFAGELASILKQEVLAPTETLWVGKNGEMFISDNDVLAEMWYNDGDINHSIKETGTWKRFTP